jgi:hypothetical protein
MNVPSGIIPCGNEPFNGALHLMGTSLRPVNQQFTQPIFAANKTTIKNLIKGRSARPIKSVSNHGYSCTARQVSFKDFQTTMSKNTPAQVL